MSFGRGRAVALFTGGALFIAPLPSFAASLGPAESTSPPASSPSVSLRAAILPVAVEGELSDVDKETLTGELVEGLRRGAFEVVPPPDVLKADSSAAGCADKDCFVRVAKATRATHLVRAKVVVRDR